MHHSKLPLPHPHLPKPAPGSARRTPLPPTSPGSSPSTRREHSAAPPPQHLEQPESRANPPGDQPLGEVVPPEPLGHSDPPPGSSNDQQCSGGTQDASRPQKRPHAGQADEDEPELLEAMSGNRWRSGRKQARVTDTEDAAEPEQPKAHKGQGRTTRKQANKPANKKKTKG